MVQPSWVKEGAVVIDVNKSSRRCNKRKGMETRRDVHPDVANIASIMSPVPGGVGPMTVAMLMAILLQQQRDSLRKRLIPNWIRGTQTSLLLQILYH